ncbi:MAG: HD domain-containing protein [Candidatus Hydrogenedentes bacterium]|nr:HD domain-containing protein [Candidatus Hydrogenedentota bacterium]
MTRRQPDKARAADPGLASVRRLAREVDPEPEHAFQVCKLAEILFDRTTAVHGLGSDARRLLSAGALLHDIGHTIGEQGHHKHARDMIRSYDLPGFSGTERAIVAAIARYHRKAHPSKSHKIFCELDSDSQALVTRLAAILRIADGLDRAHDAAVRDLRAELQETRIAITAGLHRSSPTDIWGGQRKRGLFEETFGLEVEITGEVEER